MSWTPFLNGAGQYAIAPGGCQGGIPKPDFKGGQELPIHSHDIEGQVSLVVLEGEGDFLGENGQTIPARVGDVLVSDISEPHGLRATTDLRLLVTIAPPI